MANNPQRVLGMPRGLALFIFAGGFLAGGIAAGYYGVRHVRSYLRMGNAPEQVTAVEAGAIPLDAGPRWVHLNNKLQLDCEQALQQTSNGSVEFTEYLAQDEAGQHSFFVRYKGDTDCNAAYARPLQGLLNEPPMYWWTKNNMPAPKFQSVELQVGYEPVSELYESIWAFLAAAMMLGLVVFGFVKDQQVKTQAARRAMYGGIPVPKSL
jgi:hypothetical protein